MNSFDISDDEFKIDDSEFAVVNPKGQAAPPQSASQRILAERQQQLDQEQSLRMQGQYQAQHQQQPQYQQQPQQQSHYQEKIRQYQEQQAIAEAQHASQRMQAQAPQPQPQVVHEPVQEVSDGPIGWAPTKVDSKFDQKELNSIKGAAKQTVMGGHKTQENNRISVGGVDQTESTRMGRDTLQSIRALKHGPAPEPPPKPDSGFMGKIKKLFGGKD